ncbi:prohibitin family protein [Marivirga atlantica]|jgi:regulator of protease activity HflC (stomatin/prohibitin superfamily)|uniref:Prohibitin family protein n=1 Tax=Marivirga atlantica TaxID=1548457 RepID=A0A937AH35_9BACT|nr:prohibitin family protein [Marivirga atlantica]MBL0766636.1 prohibitin family protein [Marivirga atlantica]
MKKIIMILTILILIMSCVTVRQGEVGVKRKFGKINPEIYDAGLYGINPFFATMIKIPTRTMNLEVNLSLPSKEGLTIKSEISILYRVVGEKAPLIVENIGPSYVKNAILPVFRSASSDISANFMAKDMHSGKRSEIEAEIKDRMSEVLAERGFIIEEVLLKSIELPKELSMAIERKLKAEQESMEMEFILQIEKQEAERRRIEAEGNRDAQKILSEGLNEAIIKLRSIEAFRELSKSPNAKIIITDGKTPFLIQEDKL